jgi:hypothetical protein
MFQYLSNVIRNSSSHWVLTLVIALWTFRSPPGFRLPKWKFLWECEGSFPHTFLHSQASLLACNLARPCLGRKPKAKVVTQSESSFGSVKVHSFTLSFTPELPFWPTTLQDFTLVASPRLGLQHKMKAPLGVWGFIPSHFLSLSSFPFGPQPYKTLPWSRAQS